jgi:hypothetical protein
VLQLRRRTWAWCLLIFGCGKHCMPVCDAA